LNYETLLGQIKLNKINKPKCPKCSSKDSVVPIAYGLPGDEMRKESSEGKIVLGGCIIREDAPDWYCKECENDF
jgi:hypothetical protein